MPSRITTAGVSNLYRVQTYLNLEMSKYHDERWVVETELDDRRSKTENFGEGGFAHGHQVRRVRVRRQS